MAEPTTQKNNIHLVYGVAFTIIALVALIALVFYKSRADTSTENVVVSNQAPVISSIFTTTAACEPAAGTACQASGNDISTFTLTEDAITSIFFNGLVTDNNGCVEVTLASGTYSGAIARTNIADASGACSSDANNCYPITEGAAEFTVGSSDLGACSGTADLQVGFEGTEEISYFADPTDSTSANAGTNWTVFMSVTDSAGTASAVATDTFEIDSLTAVLLRGSSGAVLVNIGYGTVALNADSTEKTTRHLNSGNRTMALTTFSSAHGAGTGGVLTCTGTNSTNIEASQVTYNLTSAQNWASGTAMSATATAVSGTVAQRTDDTAESLRFLYFTLRMPTTGVAGTCTNTVDMTASRTGS